MDTNEEFGWELSTAINNILARLDTEPYAKTNAFIQLVLQERENSYDRGFLDGVQYALRGNDDY